MTLQSLCSKVVYVVKCCWAAGFDISGVYVTNESPAIIHRNKAVTYTFLISPSINVFPDSPWMMPRGVLKLLLSRGIEWKIVTRKIVIRVKNLERSKKINVSFPCCHICLIIKSKLLPWLAFYKQYKCEIQLQFVKGMENDWCSLAPNDTKKVSKRVLMVTCCSLAPKFSISSALMQRASPHQHDLSCHCAWPC